MTNPWIEAMRLRTLPVSVAGVLGGVAVALGAGYFRWLPALLCLLFALGAQILSNFANEYFDYKNGIDRPGREGFRRGLAEGDLPPSAMKRAIILLLAADAVIGLSLVLWGGWWLVAVGAVIFIGAIAYSGGPWPLSHHGMGDIAVIIFYGLVPVCLTACLQFQQATGLTELNASSVSVMWTALPTGLAVGLMGADVLIVNNYRDADDDRMNGKRTTVVIFGRPAMSAIYLIFWLAADILLCIQFARPFGNLETAAGLAIFVAPQTGLWLALRSSRGARLNPLLRKTALLMLLLILACIGVALLAR
ncbi:MAG: 1,4-dihydroxy-2-naphthoate octaprenyltransferase [Bacteroides sp.]|nr:1,4-dihydroxy-2-naphthoate octaprenyltransferase [Bacteroides sp.]